LSELAEVSASPTEDDEFSEQFDDRSLSRADTGSRVSLSTLEAHLWGSANLLRGPIDQADFKSYVFPLLFLKRISDVYDEESAQALEESGGDVDYAGFAENHRFQIPDGAHWRDVRETSANVGVALQNAMRQVEMANPSTLYGVFGDTQWSNKDRLPDRVLRDLIEHLSKLPLSNSSVEPDMLGNAYEYLIKRFADLTNKKAGEFYTPRSVVRMMVNMLEPVSGETTYDPACGTGGMLIEVVQHVKAAGGDLRALYGKLFGQEKNLTTSGIARMNLFLHGVEDFHVVRGDTLRDPAFYDGDLLATFDCVIANPPFSLEQWGEDMWASDRFGRNFAGVPPRKSADFAWVQHMMKSMAAKSGRLAVVLPQGALFRAAAEGRIRERILELDKLEAVIGLAPNLFYGTGLAAAIVVMRDRKPEKNEGKVIFIDASRQFRKGRNQNTLEPEHAEQILTWYRTFEDVAGHAQAATLDQIRANGGNLDISMYVEPIVSHDTPTLEESLTQLEQAYAEARAAEDVLRELLRERGLLA
jgi:type I restriction enzyme M protein